MTVIPQYAGDVLNVLEAGGYKAYLVGGCLRDMLLGRDIHDWDVATTARCADIVALFPKTVETGVRFGTVTVITGDGSVEVTTLRSDGAYSDKRRPDEVRFVDDLNEDLRRRDFTMNAMAMTLNGVLSDPYDGQGDLKRHIIRCVGIAEDRFSEDALRMFRALRFSAQLSFDIEDRTMAAIKKCAHLCASLSGERVRDETEKILLSDKPWMVITAVTHGLYAGRLHHTGKMPENIARLSVLPKISMLRWAAFCAVLWNGGFIDSADFLNDMRLDSKTIKCAGVGTKATLNSPLPDRTAIKHLLADIGKDAVLCAAAADEVLRGGNALSRVEEVLESRECFSFGQLAVTGDDLIAQGITPGIRLGGILKKLLEHVIEHPEENSREVLLNYALKIGLIS